MTKEQNFGQYIGKTVLIQGRHPHAGKIGKVTEMRIFQIIKKMGLVIEFEDGTQGTVFNLKHIKVLS